MKTTFLAGVAAVALTGAAQAAEPIQLSDDQMDGVTGGVLAIGLAFNLFSFGGASVEEEQRSGTEADQDITATTSGVTIEQDAEASATQTIEAVGTIALPAFIQGAAVLSISSTNF